MLALALVAGACSNARGPEDIGPNVPPPRTLFVVSPQGDDAAPGDEARPMRTLGRALRESSARTIVARAGRYVESISLDRDIAIRGEPEAVLEGKITVGQVVASIVDLDVEGGVVAGGARNLALESLVIGSSSAAHALDLASSVASLLAVELRCGPETCLQAGGSTVAADQLVLASGRGSHKRGLRAETSSVTLRGVRAGGAAIAEIVAGHRTHLTVSDATITGLLGNGLVALDGARLRASRIRIEGRGTVGVLSSASELDLSEADVGPLADDAQGVGILGGRARIADSRFVRAGATAITVNNHRALAADVVVERVTIDHGARGGIQLGQGALVVRATKLSGDPRATRDGADAIMASGNSADLVVESADIDDPAAYGVGVYNDAGARITARIQRPRKGGVLIEDTAGATLSLRGTTVADCKQGSGVTVKNALDVSLEDVEVARCPEAGLLAALGAEVTVARSRFLANKQYGVAAFGQSTISLSGSTVRGSKWAVFASCGDGAVVGDGGKNTLEGPAARCP